MCDPQGHQAPRKLVRGNLGKPGAIRELSQSASPRNGGFEHMSDRDFLDRVQLVASFNQGIDFDFEEALDA